MNILNYFKINSVHININSQYDKFDIRYLDIWLNTCDSFSAALYLNHESTMLMSTNFKARPKEWLLFTYRERLFCFKHPYSRYVSNFNHIMNYLFGSNLQTYKQSLN